MTTRMSHLCLRALFPQLLQLCLLVLHRSPAFVWVMGKLLKFSHSSLLDTTWWDLLCQLDCAILKCFLKFDVLLKLLIGWKTIITPQDKNYKMQLFYLDFILQELTGKNKIYNWQWQKKFILISVDISLKAM